MTRRADLPAVDTSTPIADLGTDERFLRIREVAAMVGLSHSQVYALAAEGTFPAALRLGPNYSRWLASEVRAWMRARVAQAARARRLS